MAGQRAIASELLEPRNPAGNALYIDVRTRIDAGELKPVTALSTRAS